MQDLHTCGETSCSLGGESGCTRGWLCNLAEAFYLDSLFSYSKKNGSPRPWM